LDENFLFFLVESFEVGHYFEGFEQLPFVGELSIVDLAEVQT
jgi:hypothetical protein